MDIVERLRKQAQSCEDGERNPKTGISSWPKESTIEWEAANLIQDYKAKIDQMANGLESIGIHESDYKENGK
jgi:flagellin-like hook-associated protein FlgL